MKIHNSKLYRFYRRMPAGFWVYTPNIRSAYQFIIILEPLSDFILRYISAGRSRPLRRRIHPPPDRGRQAWAKLVLPSCHSGNSIFFRAVTPVSDRSFVPQAANSAPPAVGVKSYIITIIFVLPIYCSLNMLKTEYPPRIFGSCGCHFICRNSFEFRDLLADIL